MTEGVDSYETAPLLINDKNVYIPGLALKKIWKNVFLQDPVTSPLKKHYENKTFKELIHGVLNIEIIYPADLVWLIFNFKDKPRNPNVFLDRGSRELTNILLALSKRQFMRYPQDARIIKLNYEMKLHIISFAEFGDCFHKLLNNDVCADPYISFESPYEKPWQFEPFPDKGVNFQIFRCLLPLNNELQKLLFQKIRVRFNDFLGMLDFIGPVSDDVKFIIISKLNGEHGWAEKHIIDILTHLMPLTPEMRIALLKSIIPNHVLFPKVVEFLMPLKPNEREEIFNNLEIESNRFHSYIQRENILKVFENEISPEEEAKLILARFG